MGDSSAKTLVRVWFVGIGALLLGAGVVALGGVLSGLSDYDQSIFVNVGTAIALIGPLYVAERLLANRIAAVERRADAARTSAEAAEKSADAARTRVDQLSGRVQARLDELRAKDRAVRDRAATGQSQPDLVGLYDRAARNHSIDRLGLRVAGPDPLDWWLRVRAVHRAPEGEPVDLIELSCENGRLETVGETVVWSEGEPAEDVFVRLATSLQDVGVWQGDQVFDAEAILRVITDALGKVIDIRTGPSGDPAVRQIASLVNDEWAVTREGLDPLLSRDVWAESEELVGDTHLTFQRLENQVKIRGWDKSKFMMAFGEAERVHTAFRKNVPR